MTNQQGRLRTRVAVFACVAAAALIVDQLTKAWAMAALSNGQTIRVIPGLLSFTWCVIRARPWAWDQALLG